MKFDGATFATELFLVESNKNMKCAIMYPQILMKLGHLALVQTSGLGFRYILDQQTSSDEC